MYLKKSKSIGLNKMFQLQQNKCHYDRHKSVINITSWAILPSRDEDALENAVANIGPIAVSINASPETFQLYR